MMSQMVVIVSSLNNLDHYLMVMKQLSSFQSWLIMSQQKIMGQHYVQIRSNIFIYCTRSFMDGILWSMYGVGLDVV